MKITVELYGVLRQVCGCRETCLELDANVTVEQALQQLNTLYPELADYLSSTAVAVNDELTEISSELTDGQVLALIPPVSGG